MIGCRDGGLFTTRPIYLFNLIHNFHIILFRKQTTRHVEVSAPLQTPPDNNHHTHNILQTHQPSRNMYRTEHITQFEHQHSLVQHYRCASHLC